MTLIEECSFQERDMGGWLVGSSMPNTLSNMQLNTSSEIGRNVIERGQVLVQRQQKCIWLPAQSHISVQNQNMSNMPEHVSQHMAKQLSRRHDWRHAVQTPEVMSDQTCRLYAWASNQHVTNELLIVTKHLSGDITVWWTPDSMQPSIHTWFLTHQLAGTMQTTFQEHVSKPVRHVTMSWNHKKQKWMTNVTRKM